MKTLDLILCMAVGYGYVLFGLSAVTWIIFHILEFSQRRTTMAPFITFLLGLFIGGTVCLFGVALVASGERSEYSDGYADGYNDAKREEMEA